tara:strand:- start:25 stop:273 length:249 start_codon:yes stop_codon:yes gene_type:complete
MAYLTLEELFEKCKNNLPDTVEVTYNSIPPVVKRLGQEEEEFFQVRTREHIFQIQKNSINVIGEDNDGEIIEILQHFPWLKN